MLFAKPCLVGRRRRRQRKTYRVLKKDDDQPDPLHPSINERVYRTGEAHDDNDALYGSDYEYEEEGEEDDAEHSLIEDVSSERARVRWCADVCDCSMGTPMRKCIKACTRLSLFWAVCPTLVSESTSVCC